MPPTLSAMCGLKPRLAHSHLDARGDVRPRARGRVDLAGDRLPRTARRVEEEVRLVRRDAHVAHVERDPCRIVGSGSLTTLTDASCLSMKIAERTTTLPRSNGPATAGTTIESPNGAPLYGP
jgi:hypothetical protein